MPESRETPVALEAITRSTGGDEVVEMFSPLENYPESEALNFHARKYMVDGSVLHLWDSPAVPTVTFGEDPGPRNVRELALPVRVLEKILGEDHGLGTFVGGCVVIALSFAFDNGVCLTPKIRVTGDWVWRLGVPDLWGRAVFSTLREKKYFEKKNESPDEDFPNTEQIQSPLRQVSRVLQTQQTNANESITT